MTNPPTFLDLAAHPFVAGVLGALVGWKFVPGLTWVERDHCRSFSRGWARRIAGLMEM